MTKWGKFNFGERIRDILQDVKYYRKDHPFRRQILTAYQIAIEFVIRYSNDFEKIKQPIGVRNTG